MKLTPFELDVLMHYYTRPSTSDTAYAQYDSSNCSNLYNETIEQFIDWGVWGEVDGDYNTGLTDLGKAWCKVILKTPLPRQVFVDENDDII